MPAQEHVIAGIDEAGRGALAGPVVACAVAFKDSFDLFNDINDSKQLSETKRSKLFDQMRDTIYLGVGIVSHRKINRMNILQATFLAMSKSVRKIPTSIDHVIIDGNKTPNIDISCEAIVKADTKIDQVKAASICAKVIRDRLMIKYHRIYSEYGFDGHKGYGTKKHYDSLFDHGHCPIHRTGFNLNKQLTLFN